MLGKLALLLKSKIAIAAVGAVLVAGAGATAVGATTGGHFGLGPLAPGQGTATKSSGGDEHGGQAAGSLASATPTETGDHESDETGDSGENEADDGNEQDVSGSVQSVGTAHSSFVLRMSDGTTKTITVSSATVFGGGIHSLADLQADMKIEASGAKQSDGSLAATRVRAEENGDTGENTGGSHDSGSSSSGTAGGE